MVVEISPRFNEELDEIVFFIAKDNPYAARQLFKSILKIIEAIPDNPYIHRAREGLKDVLIREFVYKGYTVSYLIDEKNYKIIILGIFNRNQWKNK